MTLAQEENLIKFAKMSYSSDELKNKSIKEIAYDYMVFMIDLQKRLVDDRENNAILKRNVFERINNKY